MQGLYFYVCVYLCFATASTAAFRPATDIKLAAPDILAIALPVQHPCIGLEAAVGYRTIIACSLGLLDDSWPALHEEAVLAFA